MRRLLTVTAIALFTAGCGSGNITASDEAATHDERPTTTSTSVHDAGDADDEGGGAADSDSAAPVALGADRWLVSGVEVWSRSLVDPLPLNATQVRFTGTFIDSGDGPMACVGAVLTSLPPQCGGPIVAGLDLRADEFEASQDTVWADRTVEFSWPPVDGQVELLAISAHEPLDTGDRGGYEPPEMPPECATIETWVDGEILGPWAEANPDRAGVPFAIGPSKIGLQVVGDVEAIRAEIIAASGDPDAEPCLVEVEYSNRQLLDAQQRLGGQIGWEAGITGSGAGNLENRLNVSVVVADVATVERVLELADADPGMLRIDGTTVILVGEG